MAQLDRIEERIEALHEKFDSHQVSIVQRVTKLETGSVIFWMLLSPCLAGIITLLVKLLVK
jgi:hypothetical protein